MVVAFFLHSSLQTLQIWLLFYTAFYLTWHPSWASLQSWVLFSDKCLMPLKLKHELQSCAAESTAWVVSVGLSLDFRAQSYCMGVYLLSWYFNCKSELLIYGEKQPAFPCGCTTASCPCCVILFPSNIPHCRIRREENKIQNPLLSLNGKFSIWLNLEDLLLFSIHKVSWLMPGDNLSRRWEIAG